MFFVSAIVALIVALIVEHEQWIYPYKAICHNIVWIILLGITEGIGFTLCNLGQQYAGSSRAALIFSLESAFAAVACYIFLDESLSTIEILGCGILFFSTTLVNFESSGNDSCSDDSSNEIKHANDVDYEQQGTAIDNTTNYTADSHKGEKCTDNSTVDRNPIGTISVDGNSIGNIPFVVNNSSES